jgi:hypothetical protein
MVDATTYDEIDLIHNKIALFERTEFPKTTSILKRVKIITCESGLLVMLREHSLNTGNQMEILVQIWLDAVRKSFMVFKSGSGLFERAGCCIMKNAGEIRITKLDVLGHSYMDLRFLEIEQKIIMLIPEHDPSYDKFACVCAFSCTPTII